MPFHFYQNAPFHAISIKMLFDIDRPCRLLIPGTCRYGVRATRTRVSFFRVLVFELPSIHVPSMYNSYSINSIEADIMNNNDRWTCEDFSVNYLVDCYMKMVSGLTLTPTALLTSVSTSMSFAPPSPPLPYANLPTLLYPTLTLLYLTLPYPIEGCFAEREHRQRLGSGGFLRAGARDVRKN